MDKMTMREQTREKLLAILDRASADELKIILEYAALIVV